MISLIIPVYNIGKKKRAFHEAIKSVLHQSYSDIEILLINDGSTDDTLNVLSRYCSGKVSIISKKNGGVESARREGLLHAHGDYILHMDQDDLYLPDAFHSLIKTAEITNADVVVANNARFIFDRRLRFGEKRSPSLSEYRVLDHDSFMKEYYQSFFGINDFPVNIWNKLYKKSFLEKIPDPPLTHCIIEDLSYNMHILPYAERIAIIPDVTYLYRWGGWTNHFDPTILNTALIGYRLKRNLIEQYSLPFIKTTAIELINYLNTYFYSLLEYNKVSELPFKKEVDRVLEFQEVKEACSTVKHGMERFPHMEPIINRDIDGIYDINHDYLEKNRTKNAIKRVALFFSNR